MSALRLASIALIAGLMTSDGRAQADTDIAAGKIRNWSHGRQALAIMDFEDNSGLDANGMRLEAFDASVLKVVTANAAELQEHEEYLAVLDKIVGKPCVWWAVEA